MVVALHVNAADTHLGAFANHESHLVLVFIHRFFAVTDFGEEEAFGTVMVEHRLARTFELRLAIDLARNHMDFHPEVIFGNFVTTIQNSGIKSGEFLHLEHQVHIGTIVTHVIHPCGHIVKQSRSIKRAYRVLDFFRKRSRGKTLPRADANTSENRTLVHVMSAFDTNLVNLILNHILVGYLRHVQQLGIRHTDQSKNK